MSKLPAVVRYAIPPAATALAFLIQDLAVPEPSIAPFVFFFAVVLASLLAGRAAGLATVALSALTANYHFLRPFDAWSLDTPALTVTVLFVFAAGAGALLSGSLRGALESLQRAAEKLDASQARWKSLFEHAPIPVWEEDFSERVGRRDPRRALTTAMPSSDSPRHEPLADTGTYGPGRTDAPSSPAVVKLDHGPHLALLRVRPATSHSHPSAAPNG